MAEFPLDGENPTYLQALLQRALLLLLQEKG